MPTPVDGVTKDARRPDPETVNDACILPVWNPDVLLDVKHDTHIVYNEILEWRHVRKGSCKLTHIHSNRLSQAMDDGDLYCPSAKPSSLDELIILHILTSM